MSNNWQFIKDKPRQQLHQAFNIWLQWLITEWTCWTQIQESKKTNRDKAWLKWLSPIFLVCLFCFFATDIALCLSIPSINPHQIRSDIYFLHSSDLHIDWLSSFHVWQLSNSAFTKFNLHTGPPWWVPHRAQQIGQYTNISQWMKLKNWKGKDVFGNTVL